jgi:RNA polymerase sigma-70 factor (ECF subfamily)
MPDKIPPYDPAAWLTEHGDYLYRYALLQLRDEAAAEDAVQETLLAALDAWQRFSGQASVKTWLTGILKHKILDHFRKRAKEPQYTPLSEDPEAELARVEAALFDATGHWIHPPSLWNNPESNLMQQRFWQAFVNCLAQLAPAHAQVFQLRELDGLSTEAICKDLQITSTNCWVMLYRARLGLQQCLDQHWGDRRSVIGGY